ncbi:hypothetical protein AX25_03910 [Listeria ivanovii WSLC3009]|nr:hypothetical protein AX25_03910 [Listeria ivanovii WSLC3009]
MIIHFAQFKNVNYFKNKFKITIKNTWETLIIERFATILFWVE